MSEKQPDWLRERVNDPYGTKPKHPFWDTVKVFHILNVEDKTVFKIFEKDGWRAYNTRYNSWMKFSSEKEALDFVKEYRTMQSSVRDPWN
jgi:hypothetical protein